MAKYLLVLLLSMGINLMAQSPNLFNYQSVIRNNSGEVISDQDVSLKISIMEGTVDGSVVYTETFDTSTNSFGLVNLKIGSGIVAYGAFDNISWGTDSHFINVAIDINGGTNYSDIGTTQLVSVPYALHAETSGDSYFEENQQGHIHYSQGRIGVGTDNPQKAIHIRRVTKNGVGVGQAQLLVEADSESDATIYLGYYPNSNYNDGEGLFWRLNSDKPNGNFSIADEVDNETGGDGSEKRFVIEKNTGNVGIGITEPKRKLHISEAVRMEPQAVAPENPAMGDIYFGTDGKLHFYTGNEWDTSGNNYFEENQQGHIHYSQGRIGVGTDNPQKAIHIRRVTKNGVGVGQAQLLVEADSESDATIYLGYYPNNNYNEEEGLIWRINSDKPNGNFSIADEVDNEAGGNGSEKRLVIEKNTGNIGVGITEPKRKLHISEAVRMEPQVVAPENPAMGDMYFGSDGKLHLFDGTNWNTVNMTPEI